MREIRPYGSARGVRSNPYPYRDILQPLRSSVSQNPNQTQPAWASPKQQSGTLFNRDLTIEELANSIRSSPVRIRSRAEYRKLRQHGEPR